MKKIFAALCACMIASAAVCGVSAETSNGIIVHEEVNDFYIQYYGEYPDYVSTADRAIDGDITTEWIAGDTQWGYMIWEMPEAVSISGYELVGASDSSDNDVYTPVTWILHASNNYDPATSAGDWYTISEVIGNTALKEENRAVCAVTFSEAAPAYKYYQLEIADVTTVAGYKLAEIRLLTEEKSPQTYDPFVISAVTSVIALAGYALTKKK